jgi:hypothetical protein
VKFDHGGNGYIHVFFNDDQVVDANGIVTAPDISGPHTITAVQNAWALNGWTPDLQIAHDNVVMHVD